MVFAAFMAGSGCIKDKEKDFAEDQVSFSANTGALETRTDYGEDGSVGGTSVTYVNWVAGDKIMILSSTGSNDTYTVSEDHDGSDSQGISKGNVNPDNSGIAWGTGEQTFYAMYPANVSGSSLTSSAMTCVVPVTWTPASETELGQLPYGYMFAKETTSRTTSVSLTFNAKFTSFTFTLKNPTASPVTLSSLSLSSENKAMSGTFTVNPSTGAIASLPTPGANKSVTVDFTLLTDGGLVIPAGSQASPGTKTFTIVTVPDTFNDLTVTCTNSGGASRTLGLKKAGTYLSFAALKKHNISITLPDFASYDYDFSVINPTDLTYAGGTAHATIVSTKTPAGGSAQSASWTVEGYYTDAACTAPASGYTSFLPNGIDNGSGGGNGDISFSYAAATPSAVSSNYQSVAEADIAASTFGSGSSTSKYLNLSNPTNMESDYIRESANSYIVNGVGYYKIPLVMGNGVKFNQANTAAYDGTNFINYKGNTVKNTGPYLHNTGSNPYAAYVVWEDVSGLIEADASYNLAGTPIVKDSKGVYWLRFHVNQAKQGNAVIAVTDGTNVMWSYHIWVTNYIPQNYPGGGSADGRVYNTSYTVMPVNLGWVYDNSGSTSNVYPGACVYVKLRQVGGKEAVMKVERPRYSETTTTEASTDSPYGGYSPYYQWGRKDAFWPGTCPTNDTKGRNVTTYGKNPASASSTNTPGSGNSTSTSGITTSISNPHQFITASPWWGASDKHDLWNKGQTSYLTSSSSTNKTIYDPCPVGYCIPCLDTFNNYTGTSTGTVVFKSLGIADQGGVYFHNCGYRDKSGNLISRLVSGSSGSSFNFGMCALSGSYDRTNAYYLYFINRTSAWTVTPKAHSYQNSAGYTVRPMQDPTFDPTDDGTFRSTGPDINWVN